MVEKCKCILVHLVLILDLTKDQKIIVVGSDGWDYHNYMVSMIVIYEALILDDV